MAENTKKYVSLTFDDGPNLGNDHTMNDMLDLLEKYNIPASFFLIGNKITPENTKIIERAIKLGCDIENHSWSHPAMNELTEEQILEEYNKCDEAIIKITGKKPDFFRPPYIAVSNLMFQTIKTTFICGQGCDDWIPEVPAEDRYNKMITAAADGIMYLLHVNEGNKATLEAVDRIVPELKEQGYTFVTVPELFAIKHQNNPASGALWTLVKDSED